MIIGGHITIASANEDADKMFFREILNLPNVDAGGGYLIFGLPSGEVAIHGEGLGHTLHLMCADIEDFLELMDELGIAATPAQHQMWGTSTNITLPGGGTLTVYEPAHKRPTHGAKRRTAKKGGRAKNAPARKKAAARKAPARKAQGRKIKKRAKKR